MGYSLSLLLGYLKGFGPYLIIFKTLTPYYLIEKLSKKSKLPPGPKPWPIVGNLLEMLANKPTHSFIHNMMKEMNTKIACIRVGNVYIIPVTCPTIAREILQKQDGNFASRPLTMTTDNVTRGYKAMGLVPYVEHWKKMKKILTHHLFSTLKHDCSKQRGMKKLIISRFIYVYNLSVSDSRFVNIRSVAQHYSSNLMRKLIFNTRYFGKGRNDGGPGFEEEEYVDAIFILINHIYAFCVSDYVPLLRGLFDLDGHEKIVKNAMSILKKYNDPIIEQRIKKWNNEDGSSIEAEDMFDILLSLKDSNDKPLLTSEEINAQITELMMIVGVDNPSNIVECAVAEMINQPNLLQRAIEEVDNVVGKERLVQESDIPKLNYVKACVRETLRLHPITPFVPPHVSLNDTMVDNYLIPKGSHVILSRQGLGRNPKVWSDEPHKFKPERHLNNVSMVSLLEQDLKFITFGIGRRGCPSVMLGTTMSVMLLARLIHGFTWSLPSNVSTVNLDHSNNGILLEKPLVIVAKPRLAKELYHI